MTHPRRWMLPLLAFALAGTFAGRDDARAQEKKVDVKPAPVAKEKKADVKPAVRLQPAAPVDMVANAWPDEQFEQWFFQQTRSAAAARKRLEGQLSLLLDEIDRACQLDAGQKAKLRVTGQGDLKRLFDGFEAAKRRFNEVNNDVNQLGVVLQEFRGAQMAANSGVFEANSLFVKSLRNTLTPGQFAKYETLAAERRLQRHRAGVGLALAFLEQSVPFREDQRQAILKVMLDDVKPMPIQGVYEMYWFMDQLAALPDAKFKNLFTDLQWKIVQRQMTQYKGIIPQLKQMGAWADDGDDGEAAPKK